MSQKSFFLIRWRSFVNMFCLGTMWCTIDFGLNRKYFGYLSFKIVDAESIKTVSYINLYQ